MCFESFQDYGLCACAPIGRDIAWKFLKDKWTVFDEKFGGGLFIISAYQISFSRVMNNLTSLISIHRGRMHQ